MGGCGVVICFCLSLKAANDLGSVRGALLSEGFLTVFKHYKIHNQERVSSSVRSVKFLQDSISPWHVTVFHL